MYALPIADLKNIIGEVKNINWNTTGKSWPASLNFPPIKAAKPEKEKTIRNILSKGIITINKLTNLTIPKIKVTNIMGREAWMKQKSRKQYSYI